MTLVTVPQINLGRQLSQGGDCFSTPYGKTPTTSLTLNVWSEFAR